MGKLTVPNQVEYILQIKHLHNGAKSFLKEHILKTISLNFHKILANKTSSFYLLLFEIEIRMCSSRNSFTTLWFFLYRKWSGRAQNWLPRTSRSATHDSCWKSALSDGIKWVHFFRVPSWNGVHTHSPQQATVQWLRLWVGYKLGPNLCK